MHGYARDGFPIFRWSLEVSQKGGVLTPMVDAYKNHITCTGIVLFNDRIWDKWCLLTYNIINNCFTVLPNGHTKSTPNVLYNFFSFLFEPINVSFFSESYILLTVNPFCGLLLLQLLANPAKLFPDCRHVLFTASSIYLI